MCWALSVWPYDRSCLLKDRSHNPKRYHVGAAQYGDNPQEHGEDQLPDTVGLYCILTLFCVQTVLRCKVAIVGDATVGKTALLQVLKSNGHEYPKNYVMVRLYMQ